MFDCESSANQHEEALRTLGELMGFEATRPEKENDQSTTLDVLWRCHDTKQAILFPLKSKKKKKSPLNLEEVGKAFDHQQWFLESYPDYNPLGTIFVAENQSVTKNANPSAQMWITTPSIIKNAFDELLGILLAIESKTPIEKRAEIDALSERVEWSMTGWYKQIKGQNANSAKAV